MNQHLEALVPGALRVPTTEILRAAHDEALMADAVVRVLLGHVGGYVQGAEPIAREDAKVLQSLTSAMDQHDQQLLALYTRQINVLGRTRFQQLPPDLAPALYQRSPKRP